MAEDTQNVAPPQYTPSADETGALEALKTGPMKSVAEPFERLYKQSQQASFENETAKRKQAETLAKGKSDAVQTMYAGMQEQKTAMDKMAPPPKMNITPDTHEGLMGLATILPIAGILLGSKGMMSGVNAMNAMTGVMKGYQEGNNARIEFEKQKYDTSMKEWEANYKISRQKLADAIEMMKTNYQAGVAKAETAAVAMGPEPAALVRQNGAAFLLNKLDEANNHVLTAQKNLDALKLRESQKEATTQWVNVDGELKLSTDAEIRQFIKDQRKVERVSGASTERSMNPAASERKAYISLNNSIQSTDKLLKKLEDPDFAKKMDAYKWQNMFAEEGGKWVAQALNKNIPTDVREFIIQANALRNAYYLDISGKAVTGLEAMRNYGVVPQPGDPAVELKRKLSVLKEKFSDDRSDYMKMYPRLPELSSGQNGGPSAPSQIVPKKPSFPDFMKQSKEANPLFSDQELAEIYFKKYGGN